MKRHIIIVLSILLGSYSFAQNETDALRYSFLTHGGSSRYQAMGGALGGLGADFSVVGTNPGAMGRFSRSKAALSVDNNITTTKATYNGNLEKNSSNKFTLSHLSGIFAKDMVSKRHKWQFVQVGFGYNRNTNFHTKFTSKGINNTSIVNVFANDGQGLQPADLLGARPLTSNLAWESYAVDFDENTLTYTPRFNDAPMEHNRTIEKFGGIGEYTLAASANYNNKIYFGLSVNAHSINYREKIRHEETIIDTTGGLLLSSNYEFDLKTRGTGINAKIGVVYLPYDWLRIGVAVHTPTRTHLTDEWSADMTTTQKGLAGSTQTFETDSEFKPTGKYRYYMISPFRGILSVGAVLGGRWAIGVEGEILNYGWAKLRSTTDTQNYAPYDFDAENDEIENQFGLGYNARIGVEYLITNKVSARVGYSFYSNPYQQDVVSKRFPTMFVSGGLGYKIKNFAVDLSYSAMIQKEDYYSFDPTQSSNLTSVERLDHRINLGLSLSF